jgi:hypothetical protein
VDRAAASSTNADTLSRAVARSRAALAQVPDEADRARHAAALDSLAHYIGLLGGGRDTYTLKLELADGRWDVTERELAGRPQVGEVLKLESGDWCVRRTQLVHPSTPGRAKPAREFLVCAPA